MLKQLLCWLKTGHDFTFNLWDMVIIGNKTLFKSQCKCGKYYYFGWEDSGDDI